MFRYDVRQILPEDRIQVQPSINPSEVHKFSELAHTWWDETGSYRLLHQLNPLRLQFIKEQVGGNLKNATILDIGCGGGLLCEPLARLGAKISGIDASAESIKIASDHAERMGLAIDYQCMTAEDLTASGKTFDVVMALEIIEHVADVDSFVKSCCALVRPGGKLIISTLNRTLKSLVLAIVGAEYILRWVPRGTHNWRQFLTPAEIVNNLHEHNLQVSCIQGMTYNPLRREWQLSTDVDVNYFIVSVKDA